MKRSKILSVSVVIPNYNGRKLLEANLPAVLRACVGAQIIVVDDASTDGSVPFLREHYPQIETVELENNQRFAGACNAGAAQATGEIIVLLNNDVNPEPEFLNPLLQPFMDPYVAAVGCAEIDEQGRVSGRAGGRFEQGLIRHWRAVDQTQSNTFWVSGGSGAFRRSVWVQLGGMDTLFAPAYEEDRDFSYRLLKRGYQVQFSPRSIVHHVHETTNKTALGKKQMMVASYRNSLLFVWKNITDWRLRCEHFGWLPYHLIALGVRSKGMFIVGFIKALGAILTVRKQRQTELLAVKRTDADIFNFAKSIV
jgi:GT2 family glycosyltransferase